VLRILYILQDLNRRGGTDLYELAERYGATTRTIRRDLDALKVFGIPITQESDGRRMKFSASYNESLARMRNLLDASHYLALRMALAQAGGVLRTADKLFPVLEDLAEKIETAVGPRGREQLEKIEAAIYSYEKFLYARTAPDVFWVLVNAITEKLACQVTYQTPREDAKAKTYEIVPLRIFTHNGGVHLLAYQEKHAQVIVLNLHRLQGLQLTERKGKVPAGFKAEDWENNAFGLFTGTKPAAYRLRFAAAVAPYIRERRWHATQHIRELASGGLELSFSCPESYEVTSWVASWRTHVEVLEPASLRAELAGVGAWMMATYGGVTPPAPPAPRSAPPRPSTTPSRRTPRATSRRRRA
jgi:predicted DNA-binding transcriptional regulator YafY